MNLISKAIGSGKTLTQVLLSTSSTLIPLKGRATSTPSFRMPVGNPILSHHGGIFIIKIICRLRLILFILPIPPPISNNLPNLWILIFFSIFHESKYINIRMEHCRTTLSSTKVDAPIMNIFIPFLELVTKVGGFLRNCKILLLFIWLLICVCTCGSSFPARILCLVVIIGVARSTGI